MHSIFDAVERRELAMFEAIKAIAANSLHNEDGSLFYEILAEACRNPTVAERFETQTAFYRDGIRRLAALARHDVPAAELERTEEHTSELQSQMRKSSVDSRLQNKKTYR